MGHDRVTKKVRWAPGLKKWFRDAGGTLVVIVTDSWHACHELDPCTAEDPPYRGGRYTLNMSSLKRPPAGVVRKLTERVGQLRCRPRHLTMVQNYDVRR
ncbi:hypothetical protein TNCV_3219701 [Trichonephila clavipes]|nr:hypothetical protein TNCV_3219701 [Trichonephila clavipes]